MPDREPREAEAVLAALPWRRVTWRQGTKGALSEPPRVSRRLQLGFQWVDKPDDEYDASSGASLPSP